MFAMYICTMHNRVFIQNFALAVWVEHLALSLSASLIFPAFARLFLPHVGLSRSRVRNSLFSWSCDGFRALLEVFMFTTSSKTTISDYKSVRTCSQLDHAHIVSVAARVRMHWTYV